MGTSLIVTVAVCLAPCSVAAAASLQLLHHLVDAEAGRLLAWREVLEALDPLPDEGLRRHQQEGAVCQPVGVVDGFVLRLLERVAAQVEDARDAELHEWFRPHLESI